LNDAIGGWFAEDPATAIPVQQVATPMAHIIKIHEMRYFLENTQGGRETGDWIKMDSKMGKPVTRAKPSQRVWRLKFYAAKEEENSENSAYSKRTDRPIDDGIRSISKAFVAWQLQFV
jgi:hypothetical protein